MPKIINTEIFIKPRAAFQVVGREAYGPNWRDDWIDDPEAPERNLTLQYLRAALKSGEVAAHWSAIDFRTEGDLTPQEADREFFSIDLKSDLIFHHSMNEPVKCHIHAEQLRSFIARQGHPKLPSSQLDAARCEKWLIGQFSDPSFQPPKLSDHMAQAKEQFPRLSNDAYKRARKNAIEVTGRGDIAKGGRRTKSNQSAN